MKCEKLYFGHHFHAVISKNSHSNLILCTAFCFCAQHNLAFLLIPATTCSYMPCIHSAQEEAAQFILQLTSPSNYQPISLLPTLCKLLEHHIHFLLTEHLSLYHPISCNQCMHHCKKAFVILTIAFVTRVTTVDYIEYSHLWQPAMGNTTHMEYRNG